MDARDCVANGDPEQRFVDVFRIAARQAGSVTRRLQAEVRLHTKSGKATAEGAALTAVDLAVQDLILQLLHVALPEAAIDAEEDTDTVRLFPPAAPGRPLIVLDPVDGTLNFARQSENYAVMGAWLSEGFYRAAVVYFPAWRRIFWARKGQGCWAQVDGQHPVRVRADTRPPKIFVTRGISQAHRDALRALDLEMERSGCSGVDATAPITGKAACAVSGPRPGRRRTLGFLLTLEAGGTVRFGDRDWDGRDPALLRENRKPVLVAGSAELADRLSAALDR